MFGKNKKNAISPVEEMEKFYLNQFLNSPKTQPQGANRMNQGPGMFNVGQPHNFNSNSQPGLGGNTFPSNPPFNNFNTQPPTNQPYNNFNPQSLPNQPYNNFNPQSLPNQPYNNFNPQSLPNQLYNNFNPQSLPNQPYNNFNPQSPTNQPYNNFNNQSSPNQPYNNFNPQALPNQSYNNFNPQSSPNQPFNNFNNQALPNQSYNNFNPQPSSNPSSFPRQSNEMTSLIEPSLEDLGHEPGTSNYSESILVDDELYNRVDNINIRLRKVESYLGFRPDHTI